MTHGIYHLHAPADPPDEGDRTPSPLGGFPGEDEDLPYKVEVWDLTGQAVEQVVAVSVTPAIGYAAYYAATSEFPGRIITLRFRSSVISRWTGRGH